MNIKTPLMDDPTAAAQARLYLSTDPLPSIPPSLLSSAEIHDYARLTGMMSPFFPRALKTASYEAHIGGRFIRWNEHGNRHDQEIKRGDSCILPANSISFVQVEPTFRLPNYIAIRFNLRITLVHRGLLLGTGPLVDPGFEGKLLIPLHNLTATDYDLDTNEALIWIEFTKTTFGHKPSELIASRERHNVPFPDNKKNLSPDYYLRKANGGMAIRSSIPDALEEGKQAAKNAAQSAEKMRDIGILAFVALLLALTTLYFQFSSIVQSSNSQSLSVVQGLSSLSAEGKGTSDKLDIAKTEIEQLRQKLIQLSTDLDALKRAQQSTVEPVHTTHHQ